MITVFVWKPGNPMAVWKPFPPAVGHASLAVDQAYFSFWPDGDKGISIVPGIFRTREEDLAIKGFEPDEIIVIPNLSEEAILAFWQSVIANGINYHLLRLNCCVTVALSLRAGLLGSATGRAALDPPRRFSLRKLLLSGHLRAFMKKTATGTGGELLDPMPPMTPSIVAFFARVLAEALA